MRISFQVIATDADIDHNTNGYISFSLKGHEDLFSIDSVSGAITRKGPLDCKKTIPQLLDIYVTASDKSSDPSMKRLGLLFTTINALSCLSLLMLQSWQN